MHSRLVIANKSGFYGDRLSAAVEIVRGGPIDVLAGVVARAVHERQAAAPGPEPPS